MRQQILRAPRRGLDGVHRSRPPCRVARLAQGLDPFHLLSTHLVRHTEQVDGRRVARVLEAIDAHHDRLTRLDGLLREVRAPSDPVLHVALLDGRDRAAQRVDLEDEPPRLGLEVGRQLFYEVGARERVHGLRHAGLEPDHLLRAERQRGRGLGGKREGLVVAVRVERLGPAHHRRERLQRHPGNVYQRLLRRQRRARRLGVEAQHHRLGLRRAKPLAHDLRPQLAGGPKLGDLLEEVVVRVEEEAQPLPERVHIESGLEGGLDVCDAVGQGEGEFLSSGRPCLADVVAADRDRIPARRVLGAPRERVRDEPHRGPRRVDVRPSRRVLLQDVVLDRPAQLLRVGALLLRDGHVEREQDRGRRVDRHRGRDVLEGDPVEQAPHVLDGRDRDAHLADFALGDRIVGVVADLGRQVERDAQAACAGGEQRVIALVRGLGRREAGVLAHRPQARSVHLRVDTARKRKLAWLAQASLEVGGQAGGRGDGRDLEAGRRLGVVGVNHAPPTPEPAPGADLDALSPLDMTTPPSGLDPDARLRHELVALLDGGQASVTAAAALEDVPFERVNDRVPGWDHSLWDLLEHLRFTQADILEFCTDADYRDKRWPTDYWPALEAVNGDWDRTLDAFMADLDALRTLVLEGDLFVELGHAPGYTLLRQAMLAAEHNAHHLGQVIALRRQLGIWPPNE